MLLVKGEARTDFMSKGNSTTNVNAAAKKSTCFLDNPYGLNFTIHNRLIPSPCKTHSAALFAKKSMYIKDKYGHIYPNTPNVVLLGK